MTAIEVDINKKLKQDENQLEEMKLNLEKSQQLTDSMVVILDSFTGRLKKLDETIKPVYTQTLRLTRLQENVEKSLVEMDRMLAFHAVADEVETKIREGPGGDIPGYLDLLNKLKSSLEFFMQYNAHSVELGHVGELFEVGLEALSREFLQLLKKFSKPVPLAILHDIATMEDSEDLPPMELLPVRVVTDLHAIAEYLVHAPGEGHTDVMNIYAQLRSSTLGRGLNSIKEINQGGQNLLGENMPKKASFPFLPTRRGTARKIQPVPSSVGSSSMESSSVNSSESDERLEGVVTLIMASTVFLRLIQAESRLMTQIIPTSHHKVVLDELTKRPIEFFMRDGEALFHQAKRCIARNEFAVVLSCLRLIRHIHSLLPEYKAVLGELKSLPYERFPRLLLLFEKLVSSTLSEQYITFIKSDSEKISNLPKDGTVHELTSNTIMFLENLLDYSRILGEIFLGQSSFSVKSTEADRKKALGTVLVQIFNALNLKMENKAHNYESPFLAAIFLLNNYHFMHKTFKRNSHMLDLLETAYDGIEEHFEGLLEQHGRAYQRGFTKLISFLGQDISMASKSLTDKLSKQHRQQLKDRFKGFNVEFEELHRVQEQWSLPDPQLRSRVRGTNIEVIVPLYKEFHRMYGSLNFTKNPEKYVKYTPDTLELHLNSFFDGGAS